MKNLNLLITLTLFGTFPMFADEIPSSWKLPDHGRNCKLISVFSNSPQKECGAPRFEVWNCLTIEGDEEPKILKKYLIEGKIVSDIANTCSPTFAVRSVIPEIKN